MWNVLLLIVMMNPANGQTYTITTRVDVTIHQCAMWAHVMVADVVKHSAFPDDVVTDYWCELEAGND